MSNPVSHDRSKFVLYLEGIEVPFIGVRIQEAEGSFPTATLQLPATLSCLKLLPGTIVQIKGQQLLNSESSKKFGKKVLDVLLFEGEVSSIAYAKSGEGRSLQVQCSSLLARVQSAKAIAVDSLSPQLHKNAQMVYTNCGTNTGCSNITPDQKNEDKEQPDPEENSTFYISSRFGGILNAAIQVLEEAIPTGDIHKIVTNMWEFFNKSDYFFHILDVSFRLKSSVVAFPNKQNSDALSAITASVLKNLVSKMKTGTTESDIYNLYDVLWSVMEMIRYQFIIPAAPTGGIQIAGSPTTKTGNYEPLRAFFTPDMDTCPPALCNVFVPDQIINFSYQRSFFSEPTRSLTYLDWNVGKAGQVGKYGINFMIPDMKPYQIQYKVPDPKTGDPKGSVEGDYMSAFHPEEAYQGCRPLFSPVDGWFVAAAELSYPQEERTVEQITVETDTTDPNKPDYAKALKNEALKTWMLNKHGQSKQMTIQTDWNPSRMVGLPGVLIDPGFPSLTGVVSQIATEISANGQASSSITMRSVRAVYDEDPSVYESDTDNLFPYSIKSTSSDITPTLHDYLYNAIMYSHSEVGRYLYTYLMYGSLPDVNPFKELAQDWKEKAPGGVDFWDVDEKSFDSMENPHSHVDNSILNYLRTSSDKDALVLLDSMVPKIGERQDKPEEEYAKRIYLAIKRLKDEYISMSKGETIDQYLTNLTYRQLTPFKDYLAYIQATNTNSNPEYKHSIALLSDLETAGENLQTITDTAVEMHGDKGPAVKKYKLDKGVDAQLPSVKELKETIAKLEQKLADLIADRTSTMEMALEEFDQLSGLINNEITYEIQVGDSLISIASRYGTTVANILNANDYGQVGSAIQSLDVLIPGESIVIPIGANSTAMASLQRQRTQLKDGLEVEYTNTIDGLKSDIDRYKEYLNDLLKGLIPNASISNDSMEALYRPYDEHRRAHVLIAFHELVYSPDKVKVTK